MYVYSLLVSSVRSLTRNFTLKFHQSSAMSSYLIDDPKYSFLKDLGLERINNGVYNGKWTGSGEVVKSIDPATGSVIAEVRSGTPKEYDECVRNSIDAYKVWSQIPAPQRGDIVRQIGDELRNILHPLGKLVSLGNKYKINKKIKRI